MKKLLLAVLCAGLFFACGNKKQAEAEPIVDTPACQQAMVVDDTIAQDEPAAEPQEPVAQANPAKKTNPNKKATNNNSGMTTTNKPQTVENHAQQAGNRIANAPKNEDNGNSMVNPNKKKR